MKCKYEHDGDCCNAGADQYMHKCKKPCEFIWPLSNADHIRSMTDEELADVFGSLCVVAECRTVDGNVCPFYSDCPIDRLGDSLWLNWLKQPYEEDTDG